MSVVDALAYLERSLGERNCPDCTPDEPCDPCELVEFAVDSLLASTTQPPTQALEATRVPVTSQH